MGPPRRAVLTPLSSSRSGVIVFDISCLSRNKQQSTVGINTNNTPTTQTPQNQIQSKINSPASFIPKPSSEPAQSQPLELINEELFDEYDIVSKVGKLTKQGILDKNKEAVYSEPDKINCGFITVTRGLHRDYHLHCFYCEAEFAIHDWTHFSNHISKMHNELEELYEDDASSNSDPIARNIKHCIVKKINGHTSCRQEQTWPLESDLAIKCNTQESIGAYEQFGTEHCSINLSNMLTDTNYLDQPMSNLPPASDADNEKLDSESDYEEFFPRTDSYFPTVDHNYSKESAEMKNTTYRKYSEHWNEIRFGKTNHTIVMDFLEHLKSYPCLWYTCGTDEYNNALDELVGILNGRWNLMLTTAVLRNSLERIKRYYNIVLEHQKDPTQNYQPRYIEYYEKCLEITNDSDKAEVPNTEIQETKPTKVPTINIHKKSKKIVKYEKRFICPLCDKGFYFERMFKIHVRLHSEEIRPFKCDICERRFLTESMYKQHKTRHDPPKLKCDVCSKRYHYACNLEAHLKTHEGGFGCICEWCGRVFIDEKHYGIHAKFKHHSKVPHCNICYHAFKSEEALDVHLKKYHRPLVITTDELMRLNAKRRNMKGMKKKSPRRSRTYMLVIDPVTQKRRICCPDCDKQYNAFDTLYAHIAKIHGYEPIRENDHYKRSKKQNPGHFKRKSERKVTGNKKKPALNEGTNNAQITDVKIEEAQIEEAQIQETQNAVMQIDDAQNADTKTKIADAQSADKRIEENLHGTAACISSNFVINSDEPLLMDAHVNYVISELGEDRVDFQYFINADVNLDFV